MISVSMIPNRHYFVFPSDMFENEQNALFQFTRNVPRRKILQVGVQVTKNVKITPLEWLSDLSGEIYVVLLLKPFYYFVFFYCK